MAPGVRVRVVVRGVSPIVVRTIDVPPKVSLPMLNDMLLACFGWSGECLHVFEIRGRRYSNVAYVDAEPSTFVTVESLGLRLGERFCWRYDFCAGWVIDARVETFVDTAQVRVVSGRRAGPPERVRGPAEFVEWEDSHSTLEVLDIVADAIEAEPDDGGEMIRDRLWPLREWLGRDVVDRRRMNSAVLEVCGRWEQLEVPPCESSSKSASTPTATVKAPVS